MARRHTNVDKSFARFCRTGDPGALGEVFDRTAREILRVALWVTRNRADAEELLQRTFLAAIETRDRFEPGRPAVPWLMGLLAREGRRLKRERARPAPRPAPSPPVDPEAEAAAAELESTVREVRARMPEPYRDVLELHLEQGLGAKEIAERLGRPPGTVRTQLMRALQLLRRRLPSGFTLGRAPLAPGVASLANARAAVVSAAEAAAPAGTALLSAQAALSGGMLVSKTVKVAIPLALVLCLVTWLAWPEVGASLPSAPTTDSLRADVGPRVPDGTTAGPSAVRRERTEIEAPAPGQPGRGSLAIEVRWSDTGEPAAGVGVSVRDARLEAYTCLGTTDSGGSCTLAPLDPGAWRVTTSHAGPSVEQSVAVVLAAGERRSVELSAERHALLRGQVVDAGGRPVAEARIWVSGSGDRGQYYDMARSGADGRFSIPLAGKHLVGARKQGHAHSLARQVDAAAGPFTGVLLALRGAGASVVGRVTDGNGKAVERARVQVGSTILLFVSGPFGPPEAEPLGEVVLTDAEGAFRVDGVKPGNTTARVLARGFAPWLQRLETLGGEERRLEVSLAPAAVLTGTVRDAEDRPVPGIVVSPDQGPRVLSFFARLWARTDAQGRYRLDCLPEGEVTFVVRKDDARDEVTLSLVRGGAFEWDPVLDAGRQIAGVLLGPDGMPRAHEAIGHYAPPRIHPQRYETTDAGGRFVLKGIGEEAVTVEVGAITAEPLKVLEGVRPDTDWLEIRLEHADLPTARVRGKLVDHEGNPIEANIAVGQHGLNRIKGVQTDATGAFELGPMRPGPRQLGIDTRHAGRVPVDPIELSPDETLDLGTIRVLPPGRATFSVTDGKGSPVTRGLVYVYTPDGGLSMAGADVKDGRAVIEAIQPGTWRVITDCNTWPAELVVRSGVTTHLELGPRQ